MTVRLEDDEQGYGAWLADHPTGCIFNHFGRDDPANNILNRAGCRTLPRPGGGARCTTVEKVCSEGYVDIVEELGTVGVKWSESGICKG